MNGLQKDLQELKAKVAELESRISAESVAKWQPKGGGWWIDNVGEILRISSDSRHMKFGTERATEEKAQRAAVEMRRFNRLLALRDELCGNEEVDWKTETEKFIIYFNHHYSKWMYSMYNARQDVSVHFVDLESVQKACDMLNSGEVEL